MSPRLRRPEDLFADTGDPGDLSGTAAATGTETDPGMDPLAGMVPSGGPDEQGLAAMLNPSAGGVPTSGPNLGADLSATVTNPGDAALAQGMGGGMDPGMDPGMMGGEPGGPMDPGMDPEELQAEEMAAALEDPSTPPDERNQIIQQMQIAARRKLAGV